MASFAGETHAANSSEVRKTITRRYCSAVNCKRRNFDFPELSFFRFPKDKDRCRRWVINCRRSDLLNKDTDYLFRNVRLCSLHFEDKMFLNNSRNRLHCNAIPTLFNVPYKVPQSKNLSKMKSTLKRSSVEAAKPRSSSEVRQIDEQMDLKSVEERVAEICGDQTLTSFDSTAEDLKDENDLSSSPRVKVRAGLRLIRSRDPQPSQLNDEASSCQGTPEESDAKIRVLETRIELLEQQLQQAKESQDKSVVTKEKALDILKSEFSEGEGFLLQSMLKNSEEEYSDQEKCFFILLYLHGPRGYDYLRQRQINIPKPSVIYKWMEVVGYRPAVT